jgi:hypothetical protein
VVSFVVSATISPMSAPKNAMFFSIVWDLIQVR